MEHIANLGSNLVVDGDDNTGVIPDMRMEPALVKEAPQERRYAPDCYQEDRVVIMLEASDRIPPTGQFFGVNGMGYMIKANMEAAVPVSIIDVLNHAEQDVAIVDPNDANRVVGYQRQLRFPYRVLRHIKAGTRIEKKE